MKVLIFSIKSLWKKKFSTLTLILQLLLSVITFAALFTYVYDNYTSKRAVEELPLQNSYVFNCYDYYSMDEAVYGILQKDYVEGAARTKIYNAYNKNKALNLIAYNDVMINNYKPALSQGCWIDEGTVQNMPAVVSADAGLKIGDTADVQINCLIRQDSPTLKGFGDSVSSKTIDAKIRVTGILAEPTKYIAPQGHAAPEYFSAEMILRDFPAIIVPDEYLTQYAASLEPAIPEKVSFLLLNEKAPDYQTIYKDLNRYGETTPVKNLINNYKETADYMITDSLIIFAVMLFIASMGLISNYIIQEMYNQKAFTVYYLLGLTKKETIKIEILRAAIIIFISFCVSLILGGAGLMMLMYLTPKETVLLYLLLIVYFMCLFFLVGLGFINKMSKRDISESLKLLGR